MSEADPRAAAGRMEGGGYYTEHSEAQEAYGELGFEWLEQAAAEVAPPAPPFPFVICDLGAAGGGNSLEPMRRALAARTGDGPALVIHTDIPSNDFSALFELVETSPSTYLGAPGVFALAAGRSFYERLLPDEFVSLAWSSIAVHWISSVPAPIPDHIFSSFATGAAREALQKRAADDWRAFLTARAAELRPGGRVIVVGGAALDDGNSGAEGLMDMAEATLRALVDDGTLRADELARMTIPTWNRTTQEFVAPFSEAAFTGRLELRRHALRTLPDQYLAAYQSDGDRDRYVAAVAGFFRAAFEDSLWASLDPARDQAQRDAIAAAFHQGLRARIAAAPEQAACHWHVVVLDIARI